MWYDYSSLNVEFDALRYESIEFEGSMMKVVSQNLHPLIELFRIDAINSIQSSSERNRNQSSFLKIAFNSIIVIQISFKSLIQIPFKSHSNPIQIPFKSHSNPIHFSFTISFKSHSNPIQIPFKSYSHLIHISFTSHSHRIRIAFKSHSNHHNSLELAVVL
jgi:hypothetical protein